MPVDFSNTKGVSFVYDATDSHYHMDVQIVCESSNDDELVDFVYDSGAFITVTNKERYESLGLDKYPRRQVSLSGYTGKTDGYMFQNLCSTPLNAARKRRFPATLRCVL